MKINIGNIEPAIPQSPQPKINDDPPFNPMTDGEFPGDVYPIYEMMRPSPSPVIKEYPTGSVLDLAYGANDPNSYAAQYLQSGELYRISRGFPTKRAGHTIPVFPQFQTQTITIHNLASQPQANRSAAQITQPTADANTTNTTTGTPVIGRPGFNKINLT